MAISRQHDISRFFVKYRWFVMLIGVLLLVQIFLAIRLVLVHGSWEDPDGKGPRVFKWTGDSKSSSDSNGRKTDLHRDKQSIGDIHNPANANQPLSSSPRSTLSLDLDTLTFVPDCNITIKESISAIQRAKTQFCKEQLAKTACKINEDSLYVKSLPRRCVNNVTTYGKYIGCFKDDKKKRILPDNFVLLKETNSPLSCVTLCLQSGFQYAGVQYRVECFCGNTEPSASLELSSSKCNMNCPNLPSSNGEVEVTNDNDTSFGTQSWMSTNCGGYFSMNVFETGIFQGYDGKSQVVNLEGFSEHDRVMPKKTVRIVFFLTLNGRALRQVVRLIKALFHERHYFYIHVDARQDYLYRELLVLGHKLPNNIRFMANRRATIWGGASLLTILLNGMRDLTVHAHDWKWDWDYVINLSESDFPLKTIGKLEYFLSVNNGNNFLKSHGRDVQKFIQKQGLDKTFDECEFRMWRMGDRVLPTGILMDGGSDWIALHRDFVKYTVRSDDELVSGLKTVFKYTLLPAESFFHTLLRNSEMCGTFVDNNLHVTNWKRKLGCKCQYRNVVDWCGCSPNDFRMSDWNRLQLTESRLLFFGRKFESVVNQGIVNKLESWLNPQRYESHFPTLDRFWLSLYHHYDLSPKPDDALVTLGRSLSRIASQLFSSKYIRRDIDGKTNELGEEEIPLYDVNLVEMNVYNHDDKFQGILVRFQTKLAQDEGEELALSMETWFKIESKIETASWSQKVTKLRTKLKDIRVGGDYDQKEQIFRNFAGALGPFSEPTLAYSVFENESFNVTFVWTDPTKTIQTSVNVTITDGPTANFVKPALKAPLHPGIWTVKILTIERDVLYEVNFLVMPLELYQGKPISSSDERWINSRVPTENYQSITSSQTVQDWIDVLVSKFYTVQDFCLERDVNHLALSRWHFKTYDVNSLGLREVNSHNKYQNSMETLETSLCSHTQWSSLFPDPKSMILEVDPKSGLLVP